MRRARARFVRAGKTAANAGIPEVWGERVERRGRGREHKRRGVTLGGEITEPPWEAGMKGSFRDKGNERRRRTSASSENEEICFKVDETRSSRVTPNIAFGKGGESKREKK